MINLFYNNRKNIVSGPINSMQGKIILVGD